MRKNEMGRACGILGDNGGMILKWILVVGWRLGLD
jgi:hypothetical protein